MTSTPSNKILPPALSKLQNKVKAKDGLPACVPNINLLNKRRKKDSEVD